MKTESTAMYVVRLAGILLAITAVVALCLAGVNAITKPIIDELNAAKTQKAIETVLPGGFDEELTGYADETGLVSKVYKGANGYAFEVTPGGFDGEITMMVGIENGAITGISVISHTETPGLGAVAAAQNAKGEAFRSQFVGQEGTLSIGDQIDAMSGATITSNAVVTGVNAALDYVANLG